MTNNKYNDKQKNTPVKKQEVDETVDTQVTTEESVAIEEVNVEVTPVEAPALEEVIEKIESKEESKELDALEEEIANEIKVEKIVNNELVNVLEECNSGNVTTTVKIGMKVKIRPEVTHTVTGQKIPTFAYKNEYRVENVLPSRVVVTAGTYKLAVKNTDIVTV